MGRWETVDGQDVYHPSKVTELVESFHSHAKFVGRESVKIALNMCGELMRESFELSVARRVKTDGAFIAILKELNTKWKAFCRRINKLLWERLFYEWIQVNAQPTWELIKACEPIALT